MVSVRSATSLRSSASKVVTGSAGGGNTGAPKSRMGWAVTDLLTSGGGSILPSSRIAPARSPHVGRIHPHPHRIGRLARGARRLRDVQGVGERAALVPRHPHERPLAHLVVGPGVGRGLDL